MLPLLLLLAVAGAPPITKAQPQQDCYSIETDYKYNIPMGVHGTYGGCVKGVKIGNSSSDCVTKTDGTRATGSFASLGACCEALQSRVVVDPRNGQERTDQVNVSAVCNSYTKKPSSTAQQQASSSVCFAVETDFKYNIPMGVYGTYGGCVKGSKDGTWCKLDSILPATRSEGMFDTLAACCASLEPRLKIDPRNGQPRTDQANVRAACNSYAKPAAQESPKGRRH